MNPELLQAFGNLPYPPRYLLYRALGALVPYIVGTWQVRFVWHIQPKVLGSSPEPSCRPRVGTRGSLQGFEGCGLRDFLGCSGYVCIYIYVYIYIYIYMCVCVFLLTVFVFLGLRSVYGSDRALGVYAYSSLRDTRVPLLQAFAFELS